MVQYLDAVVLAREQRYADAQAALLEIDPFVNRFGPALLLRATLHYVQAEFEQARVALARLDKLLPDSLPALKLRAATMVKQGRLTEAVALLEENRGRGSEDPQVLFLLGNVHLILEDYAAATGALEEALIASPGGLGAIMTLAFGQLRLSETNGTANVVRPKDRSENDHQSLQFLRGLAHLQREEFERASGIGRALAAENDHSPLGPYLVGSANLGLKDYSAAREALEDVTEAFPGFVPAQVSLARLDLVEDRTEHAYGRANEILRHAPQNADALTLLAEISLNANRWQEAQTWLEQAIAAAPNSLKPRAAMVGLLLELGEVERAREHVQRAAVDFPSDSRTLALQVDLELQDGNTAGAAAYLSRLADIQPEHTEHRYRLAELLERQGDVVAAKQQLQEIIDRAPAEMEAHIRLVDLVLAEGKAENALFLVDRFARAVPNSSVPDLLRGRIHVRFGRLNAAVEAYEAGWRRDPSKALARALYWARSAQPWPKTPPLQSLYDWLKQAPGDEGARLFLADELLAAGDFEPAIMEYQALLKSRPESPVLLNNLAWLFLHTEDRRALEYAERALAAAPSDPAIMDTLGWVLTTNGQLERGERILRAAAELSPADPDIAYHLAVALSRSGRIDEAVTVLERSFLGNRDYDSEPEARALWARLRKD